MFNHEQGRGWVLRSGTAVPDYERAIFFQQIAYCFWSYIVVHVGGIFSLEKSLL
jgi:hypothetical protein